MDPDIVEESVFSILETAEAGGMRAWCDVVQSQSHPVDAGMSRFHTNSPETIEHIWISSVLLISNYFAKTIS